jgi:type VI secretion system lysozyme-like protein
MAFFKKFMRNDDPRQSCNTVQDIVENMNNILNTKKDYGSPLRDYGIRDLNEFNDKNGMVEIIIKEVARCVEQYEPRVRITNVVKEDETDMFKLSFRIECVIRDSQQTLTMVFDTVLNSFLVENT